ncbi:MAG: hypothetical protein KME05_20960 [Gloeocapsa sp. UFS-A4-WI-NPMV-4B04]|jgi:hypothetical protein|nr:hypothetical protein [Gloeocapsa sp. UFS-A4-WI-NPMV-4B04]
MKKTPIDESQFESEILPEYHFDYQKAKPNRFTAQNVKRMTVVLDEDIAQVFTTSESVNKALRALIEAMPQIDKR